MPKLIEPAETPIKPAKALIEPVKDNEGGSISTLVNQFPPTLKKKLDLITEMLKDSMARI